MSLQKKNQINEIKTKIRSNYTNYFKKNNKHIVQAICKPI